MNIIVSVPFAVRIAVLLNRCDCSVVAEGLCSVVMSGVQNIGMSRAVIDEMLERHENSEFLQIDEEYFGQDLW